MLLQKIISRFLYKITLRYGSSILLLTIVYAPDAYGHGLFNSEMVKTGGFIIEVETQPEIPTTGTPSKILLRVTDYDSNEITNVIIGMRIYKDDVLLTEVAPTMLKNGHYEMDYTFTIPGNHIVEVDIYKDSEKVITEKFNMSTLYPFGYIFYSMVVIGALFPPSLFAFIYFMKRRKSKQSVV